MSDKTRVYIAAPWVSKDVARIAGAAFEQAGFEITKKWWEHRDVDMEDSESAQELYEQADEDITGVLSADVFVLLNLGKSEGKAVETGIALSEGLPMILVGKRSNLFHFLPCWTIVDTINQAIEEAKRV